MAWRTAGYKSRLSTASSVLLGHPGLPGSLKHAKMNVKELLNMDPSDEQWTKMWESLWDSNWNLDEKPPAFIVDQQPIRAYGVMAVHAEFAIQKTGVRFPTTCKFQHGGHSAEYTEHTQIRLLPRGVAQSTKDPNPAASDHMTWTCRRLAVVGTPVVWVTCGSHGRSNVKGPIRAYGVMAVHAEFAIQKTGVRFPVCSATLASGTNGIDPKDDSQVRNELSTLDGLIRMSPELGVADDDEHVEPYLSTDSGSGPGDTLGPEMPVNPPDSEPETWPDETMDPTDNVETHAEPLTDLVPPSGFGDVDSPSCDEDIEERFWNENPRPQSLPPIRTIFNAIHSPTQSTQQQKPTKIWKEITELHLPQETEKVRMFPSSPVNDSRPETKQDITNILRSSLMHYQQSITGS
ncbi:uncharacterized protein EI90DRAFT_3011699 [Cantharellus anzutake]|uniref:uncharacterized protein n=1 Tax=Cantharellus anzutake TaxID=1750568 RepID=UPI001904D74D|nr:uncharacterized protein EI90DRAFT_3011699 [Cantharellus anzutake]KAF8342174.1 hypothetical protein EI90DRAFT_3011699 [Cantharellus anzutake]